MALQIKGVISYFGNTRAIIFAQSSPESDICLLQSLTLFYFNMSERGGGKGQRLSVHMCVCKVSTWKPGPGTKFGTVDTQKYMLAEGFIH